MYVYIYIYILYMYIYMARNQDFIQGTQLHILRLPRLLEMLCIESSISLGFLCKFEVVAGVFKGALGS